MNELPDIIFKRDANEKALVKLKEIYYIAGKFYYYIAGSLIICVEHIISADEGKRRYMTLDVKPLEQFTNRIEREVQYYTSKIYKKHKGKRFSFYNLACENIKEYENS